jgi:hypothetical protein
MVNFGVSFPLVIFCRGWYNRPIRESATKGVSLIHLLSLIARLQLMRELDVGTAIVLGYINVANQETRLST